MSKIRKPHQQLTSPDRILHYVADCDTNKILLQFIELQKHYNYTFKLTDFVEMLSLVLHGFI